MAKSDQRKQKKRERQNAKRKERRQQLVKRKNRSLAERLAVAAQGPVVECLVVEDFEDRRFGYGFLSRSLPTGEVAWVMFFLDAFCLGVRAANGTVGPRDLYEEATARMRERFRFKPVVPEVLKGYLEAVIAYAHDLGFEPPASYQRVAPILRGIEPDEEARQLECGEMGKPIYFFGSKDHAFFGSKDHARHIQVLKTLEERLGPDGFFSANLDGEFEAWDDEDSE